MRTPRQWWLRRQAIKEERRKAAELDKRTLEEQRKETLRKEVKVVTDSLSDVGLATPSRYSTQEGFKSASMVAVNNSGVVYRLIVFRSGGYILEKL